MLPASNKGVGMNIGFPDVCNTIVGPATVPIPYPNFAMNAQAAPFSPIVKLTMMPALNMASKIPMTSGDEAGTAHPMVKQMGAYTMGNPVVYVEKLPAINLLCPTTGNNMNNPLGAVLVPSVTNVFFTLAPAAESPAVDVSTADPFAREVSLDDLEAIERRLGGASPGRAQVEVALAEGSVGYVRIPVFSAGVPAEVYMALKELEARGAGRLVIDLRDNPGGELTAALELAGDFLDQGRVLVTMRDTDGDETVYRARQASPSRVPLAILVNRGTASAAELFAGCLKSHGRAVIVGRPTYGKGVGQTIAPGPEGTGARSFTAASFTLAHGEAIQGVGVLPDIEAEDADEQLALALDAVRVMDP